MDSLGFSTGKPSRKDAFTIKVCGIQSKEEIDIALQNGADTVGFLFVPTATDRIDAPGVDKTVDADPATYPGDDAIAVGAVFADYVHEKYPFARVALVTHEWAYEKLVRLAAEIGADVVQLQDYLPPFKLPKLKHEASVASLYKKGAKFGLTEEDAEKLVCAKEAPVIEEKYQLTPQDAEKLIDVYAWFAKDLSGWSSVSLTRRLGGFVAIALGKKYGLSPFDAKRLGLVYGAVAGERANSRTKKNLLPSAETYLAVALAQARGISVAEAQRECIDVPIIEVIKAIHVVDEVENAKAETRAVLANAAQYVLQGVDAILVDTLICRAVGSRSRIGGTGRRPDLSTFKSVVAGLKGTPLILAGGLNPDNVAEVVSEAQDSQLSVRGSGGASICGTDANSRLEDEHGVKDAYLINRFASVSRDALGRAPKLLRVSRSKKASCMQLSS